jgi:hypothetical protein
MTPTAIDLLEATRAHLCDFELPQPWLVTIDIGHGERDIDVQLYCLEPPEVAADLLTSADTLTEVTAEGWRCPDGHSLHLSVKGRLPNGAVLRVFAGTPYTANGLGAGLEPGAATIVRLSALRLLATPGQVRA